MRFLKTTVFLFLLFSLKEIKAQLPSNDATWQLSTIDDFDSLKTSLWNTQYSWKGPVNNGLEYNSPNNLLFNHTAGWLAIKCETVAPITYTPGDFSPYNYQSGVIQSKFTHKYGYFEISAKLPVGYRGYWPAFWTLGGPYACIPQGYNEIDIMENNGVESRDNILGWHYIFMHPPSGPTCQPVPNQGTTMISGLSSFANEHKYGMFWEPNRMTWYFDDMPVASVTDTVNTPQNFCGTLINFALDPNFNQTPEPGVTVFPAYYQINWLKIWQLIPDCSTPLSFCSNFNATTWNGGGINGSKVKQSITIGGAGCTDNINTSDNIRFWATDFVLLDAGTTITDNSSGSFCASVIDCPQ